MGCEVSKESKKEKNDVKDYHWITVNPCFEGLDSHPNEITLMSLLDQDNYMNQNSNIAILFEDNIIKVKHHNNLHIYIPKEGFPNVWIYNSTKENED